MLMTRIYIHRKLTVWMRLSGILSKKTFANAPETIVLGFKTKKERIILGFCYNATGTHKLTICAIRNLMKHHAFKKVNILFLLVYYKWIFKKTLNPD